MRDFNRGKHNRSASWKNKKDFANFYQIALKSSNETKYWLSILKEKTKNEKADILLKEAIEISNMLGASLITLKRKDSF